MKLRVECDVDSVMKLERPVSVVTKDITADEFEYVFTPGADGMLARIAVIAPVKRLDRFRSCVEPAEPDKSQRLVFEMDDELVDRVRAEFHAIESQLSFRFPLSRVDWQWPRYELVLETEAERLQCQVHAYTIRRETKRNPMPTDEEGVLNVLKSRFKFESLTVPLSFYREALGDFDRFRYIAAFFNFYFILEGLYGAGNTKNRLVEQAFLAAPLFCDAVAKALAASKVEDRATYERLLTELTRSDVTADAPGVARFLVRTRGKLHHFTNSSTRLEGTPFTHYEFEMPAFLAKIVTTFALTYEMVALGAAVSRLAVNDGFGK